MIGDGWTSMDGRQTKQWQRSNRMTTKIEQDSNGRQMKWWRMLDIIGMNIKQSGNGRQMEWGWMSNITKCNHNGTKRTTTTTKNNSNYAVSGTTEHSTSALYDNGVHKRKEFFFLLFRVYYYYYYYYFLLLLLELLQGLLTTRLQGQKHIGVHSLDVNLKTHVQWKQVYLGRSQNIWGDWHIFFILFSLPFPSSSNQ